MTRRRTATSAYLLSLTLIAIATLVALPTPASAQEEPERVAIGSDLRIGADETVYGDVSVTNGSLSVQGEVRGDVAVVNGSAVIEGTVNGDVAVTHGRVELGPGSHVTGNVLVIMGDVKRAPGATVGGEVTKLDNPLGSANLVSTPSTALPPGLPAHMSAPFGRALGGFARMVAWGVLSMLVLLLAIGTAALLPRRVSISNATLESQAGPSVVVGLITAMLLGPVAALTSIGLLATVIGAVLIPVLAIALVLSLVYGLVVVSLWLGKRVYETARQGVEYTPPPLPLQALLGVAVMLSATVVPAALLPGWIGWLMMPLLYFVACVGLGATILSRFGTLAPPSVVLPEPTSPGE